ncbi:MAG: hypothetical protein J5729_01640 [Bacteroidaceae bacterium]|nr:hypothetical protein [Bacteroidaceae bacterium]
MEQRTYSAKMVKLSHRKAACSSQAEQDKLLILQGTGFSIVLSNKALYKTTVSSQNFNNFYIFVPLHKFKDFRRTLKR